MTEKQMDLGSVIDDYCTRCRLIMNHSVVAIVDGDVKKVRCLTCMTEHPYRKCKGGKKKDGVQSLFDQVLAKVSRPYQPTPPPRKKKK
ncbi:MAG: hypothetical protein AB1756_09355 [Acidobacteriota bacterium]